MKRGFPQLCQILDRDGGREGRLACYIYGEIVVMVRKEDAVDRD